MKYQMYFRVGNKRYPVTVTVFGSNLNLSFPYNKKLIDEVKSMEGRKWNQATKSWTVKNSSRNRFVMDILSDGEGIARYDKPIEKQSISGLWEHQQEMYDMMSTRQRCIIAAEMRTGKTLPTLRLIENLTLDSIWWVAPTSALRGLSKELKKWNFTKKIELLTYEGFRNSVKMGYGVPQFLVFDECQKLKTPTSQQTKYALQLVEEMEIRYKGKEYVIGLSGTPAPKDPSDWWSQCEVARPGFIKESDKHSFARRLGEFEQKDGQVGQKYWALKKTMENPRGWIDSEVYALYKRLKPLVLVKLKKDCLDLPNKIYEVVDLKPSKKILRVAKTIADNAPNVITAVNKLRQLSDGFQYHTEYDPENNREFRETKFVGSPKVDRLKEDLANHEDVGRIIVYAGYQGSVDIIEKTCLESGWTVLRADGRGWNVSCDYKLGDQMYDVDFCLNEMDRSSNTGEIEKLAFVAQTDSAGAGLELSASPTIIYYSNSNNGTGRMQSEDRAHSNNMDKSRGLTIIDYCHLPTDYTIRESLMNKKDLQMISMGELKKSFDLIEHLKGDK